jgi:hypothetical protein
MQRGAGRFHLNDQRRQQGGHRSAPEPPPGIVKPKLAMPIDKVPAGLPWIYAAIATLDVDRIRTGLPPGGPLGVLSSAESASKISSMGTIRFEPESSRNAGLEATAAASDAQDARMARFSPIESVVSATTSRG